MRIFIALDIDEAIRDRIARFLDGVRGFAPDARWVRPESLHITLKFIGETAPENVDQIKDALQAVEAHAIEMNIRGSGFFPGAKSPRVFLAGHRGGTVAGCTRVDGG
jgi:RNA 2',3'-cyclic 3'-phosphodiesterase